MSADTRDITIRIPANASPEDLPSILAAGLVLRFRPGKPPLYEARDMRHVRRRNQSQPLPAA